MENEINRLALLQAVIRQTHKCEALHRHTFPVREFFGGSVIWEGNVELFELINHLESKKCYAWTNVEKDGKTSYVTVLENSFINSAEKAVRSAIFTDMERTKQNRLDAA